MAHKMYAMVDMEMDDERIIDMPPAIAEISKPRYPYGLRICLTTEELEKLNLDPSCAFVGGLVHIHGMARITAVSSNQMERAGESVDEHRIELQIESMAVESEDMENEEYEDAEPHERRVNPRSLYDRS